MKFRILLFTLLGFSMFMAYYEFSEAEYGDVILNSKKESMRAAGVKDVMFPHWFHRIRFKCKVCHEDIFILKAGANDIDMNKIMNGEYCGRCHNGIIAWEPLYCERCHSWEPGWEPGFVQHSKKIADTGGAQSATGITKEITKDK
ncbi:MAG: c(7)-type cytochrome triheme domain-containing protein [Nitrospinota bacterium]